MTHYWRVKDSRWGDQVTVKLPGKLSAPAFAAADACVRNLSLSGVLVKANVDLALNSLIKVSIKMPPPWQRAEAIAGYVSRRLNEGVGIKWCEFAPIAVRDLLRSPGGLRHTGISSGR